ncbi:MAG: hypothetical protein Q8M15_07700 [Bacteroidota bacterium]|nr:hypothetical protein [Bacteroidota bacterium]
MKTYFIVIIGIIFFFTCCNDNLGKLSNSYNENTIEISLGNNFKIIVSTNGEKFDSCKPYTNVSLMFGNELLFHDTGYEIKLLCNNYPKIKNLKNNQYLIFLEIFDAPDINKLLVINIKDGKYIKQQLLPFFDTDPSNLDIDENMEFQGTMNTIEGFGSGDSCYYNPELYYELTDQGIELDTILSKKMITKVWGGFYGYEQSDKIILPCN